MALRRLPPARVNVGLLALVALLAAALCIGAPSRVDLALILFLFPAVVWLGASTRVAGWLVPACAVAGLVSYPLYAWHMPILLRFIKP